MNKLEAYLLNEKKILDDQERMKAVKLVSDCVNAITPAVVIDIRRENIDWHAEYIWDTGYGDVFHVTAREEGLEIKGMGQPYIIRYRDGIGGKLYPLAVNLESS